MSRTLTSGVAAAAAGSQIATAHLFRSVFTNAATGLDEEFNVTDNFRDVIYGGVTYTALGHLLGFEGVEESTDLQISTVKCTLSGVDSNLISSVLSYQYIDRRMEIWRAFRSLPETDIYAANWDDAENWDDASTWNSSPFIGVIDAPVLIFAGTMDAPTITDDPTSGKVVVQLTASSYFSDFGRRPGRHTNHQEQQAFHPGDRFFEWVGSIDKNVVWGRG